VVESVGVRFAGRHKHLAANIRPELCDTRACCQLSCIWVDRVRICASSTEIGKTVMRSGGANFFPGLIAGNSKR